MVIVEGLDPPTLKSFKFKKKCVYKNGTYLFSDTPIFAPHFHKIFKVEARFNSIKIETNHETDSDRGEVYLVISLLFFTYIYLSGVIESRPF